MILIVANNLYDEIINSLNMLNKNDFIKFSKLLAIKGVITSTIGYEKTIEHPDVKLIIVDSSSIQSIEIFDDFKKMTNAKIIIVNSRFEEIELIKNKLFNFFTYDSKSLINNLMNSIENDVSKSEIIKILCKYCERDIFIINNECFKFKFFSKFFKRNNLHIISECGSKYELLTEIVCNDNTIFTGPIRMAEVLNELNIDVTYFNVRKSNYENNVIVKSGILNKHRIKQELKKITL